MSEKTIMDHVSKAADPSQSFARNSDSAEIASCNAYMYTASHTPMASAMVIESADPIRARLKEHDEFPDHHPKEMTAPGKSVRFHYKASNLPELESVLAYIKRTYVIHALNKHCEKTHLIDMRDYLTKFPLGITEPDTRYYPVNDISREFPG